MATNISKLETLLRERGYNIYCSPIFNPPRTPLDVPVIKNIGEKGIKCSGAFYVPERTRLLIGVDHAQHIHQI